jgi:predicted DNA binding CopG/RHH family protein
MNEKTVAIRINDVDSKLRMSARIKALKQGLTLRDYIIKLIEDDLSKND